MKGKNHVSILITLFCFLCGLVFISGCMPEKPVSQVTPLNLDAPIASLTAEAFQRLEQTPQPTLIPTSTPSNETIVFEGKPTHPVFQSEAIPTLRSELIEYEIVEGDTISKIATLFQISKSALIAANELDNPDIVSIGQELVIPPQSSDIQDKGYLILPDMEIINGPNDVDFHLDDFLGTYPNNYIS